MATERGMRYLFAVKIESRSQMGNNLNLFFLMDTVRPPRILDSALSALGVGSPRPPKSPLLYSMVPEVGDGRWIYAKPPDWEERGDTAFANASNDCRDGGVFDLPCL